jgi:putative membrane protein insertion efficiency factor
MNIMSSLVIGCVKAYQFILSPHIGQQCRFAPTCSQYAIEAFEKHSFFQAFYLSIKRIFSCHPWHPGGHDPVP